MRFSMQRIMLYCLVAAVLVLLGSEAFATAVNTAGYPGTPANFEVDADFRAGFIPTFLTSTQPFGNDWAGANGSGAGGVLLTTTGGFAVPGFNSVTDAAWFIDHRTKPGSDSTFFGTNADNSEHVTPGASGWDWTIANGGPGKNDITNVFVHQKKFPDPVTGDVWLFLALERLTTEGTSYVDFEYNQAGIYRTNLGGTSGAVEGNGPVGGRTINDFIISMDFVNGGVVPRPTFRVWQSNGTWTDTLSIDQSNNFAVVNIQAVNPVAPNAAFGSNGLPANTTSAYQMLEVAVNLSSLGIEPDPCVLGTTVTAKTRASASFTANLHDFAIVGFQIEPIPVCSISGPDPGCAGKVNNYTVSDGPTSTFAWSIAGNGTLSTTTGTSVNVTAGASGTYTLTVTAANQAGCTSTCAKTVAIVNPACTITGPVSVCNNSVNGYTVGDGPGATFVWAIVGQGTLSTTTGSSVNVTAGSSGGYTLTVTSTNLGCTATCQMTAGIATPSCTVTGPTVACAGTVNSHTATGGGTFAWAIAGNGTLSATNGSSVNVTAGTTGSYTLTVTQTNNGCTSTCQRVQPIVNSECTISGPSVVCANSSGSFTVADGAGATFAWSIAGQGTLSATVGSSVNVTAGSTGSYTLTVTSTNSGCTATCQLTRTIVNPACTISGPASVCNNAVNAYTVANGASATFAWSINGQGTLSTTTGSAVNVTAGSTGSYTLTVTSTAQGCTATCQFSATISAPSCSITGPAIACAGTASNYAATGGGTFVWSIAGNGTLSATTGSAVSATAGTTGSYTLTVTQTSAGCTSTCQKTVTTVNPSCTITGPVLVCVNSTNGYTAADGPDATFAWSITGNGSLSGSTGSSVNVTAGSSGCYTITVTSTRSGCTATCQKAVCVVNPACPINGPGIVGNGTTNEYCAGDGSPASFVWSIGGSGTLSATTGSCVNVTAGEVGSYTLTVTTTAGGCSSTCQRIVWIFGGNIYCTLTQGFYGSTNGKWCGILGNGQWNAVTLITYLLGTAGPDPMVIGLPAMNRSFSFSADKSACLNAKMPGGGPSAILPNANYSFLANCEITPGSPLFPLGSGGRFSNTLFAQTITLGLNLRLNPPLGVGVHITDVVLVTTATDPGVDGRCGTEDDECVDGSEEMFAIPQSVVDYLNAAPADNSVNALSLLGNQALGGGIPSKAGVSTPTLGAITQALGAINDGFDECRCFIVFTDLATALADYGRLPHTVEGKSLTPTEYDLSVNYPNPFNPSTVIEFALPEASIVRLMVYNILGQEVETLIDGVVDAGYQSVVWNANNKSGLTLPSGVYIYRIEASSITSDQRFAKVRKMLLMK